MHPKVQKGEMTEDQVFIEFLSNFADINRNGSITRDVKKKHIKKKILYF